MMKQVQRMLMISFLVYILFGILLVVFFEMDWVPDNFLDNGLTDSGCFLVQILMQLITICVIPVALRLFKFKKIHESLISQPERALAKWAGIRIHMLCLPMVLNILFYYLTMSAGFGYMAIILFLCLFFIVPTMGRCVAETTSEK
jgi:hypothetical protein